MKQLWAEVTKAASGGYRRNPPRASSLRRHASPRGDDGGDGHGGGSDGGDGDGGGSDDGSDWYTEEAAGAEALPPPRASCSGGAPNSTRGAMRRTVPTWIRTRSHVRARGAAGGRAVA